MKDICKIYDACMEEADRTDLALFKCLIGAVGVLVGLSISRRAKGFICMLAGLLAIILLIPLARKFVPMVMSEYKK